MGGGVTISLNIASGSQCEGLEKRGSRALANRLQDGMAEWLRGGGAVSGLGGGFFLGAGPVEDNHHPALAEKGCVGGI
ncbi:hypothetical protein DSLASN_39110 [Desulfoluna limicola]|uniref:Uncharacterized protein n=1 Tax=Desulfoluna limicola TaxID=2810562 RepID=A0ABN6F7S8_9BACT|nr:hypothetical protein DSLASN_39110 [Desulfoluna limicola]